MFCTSFLLTFDAIDLGRYPDASWKKDAMGHSNLGSTSGNSSSDSEGSDICEAAGTYFSRVRKQQVLHSLRKHVKLLVFRRADAQAHF